MRLALLFLLAVGACLGNSAVGLSPICSDVKAATSASWGPLRGADTLRLRGGSPKGDKGDKVSGKPQGKSAEPEDDNLQEIGGIRPEPESDTEEGLRTAFHETKLGMLQDLQTGKLQVDAELKGRKKDRDVFPKKGNAPDVFLRRYRDANRSLNPYASVTDADNKAGSKKAKSSGDAEPKAAGAGGKDEKPKAAGGKDEKPSAKGGAAAGGKDDKPSASAGGKKK